MLRWLTSIVVVATVAAAFGVTWLKHDTRRLESQLQAQRSQVEKAESDIAVLKAELGYLTRPDRLEPLARRHLGLQPVSGSQLLRIDELPKALRVTGSAEPASQATGAFKSGRAP